METVAAEVCGGNKTSKIAPPAKTVKGGRGWAVQKLALAWFFEINRSDSDA